MQIFLFTKNINPKPSLSFYIKTFGTYIANGSVHRFLYVVTKSYKESSWQHRTIYV